MVFQGNECQFDIEVIDYEHPGGGDTRADKNLLRTSLRLVENGQQWMTIAPVLHTWEVEKLIHWLENIRAGRHVLTNLAFQEPCIAIQMKDRSQEDGRYHFTLVLLYEVAPPWWQWFPEAPYVIQIECSRDELTQAIINLSGQFNRFPVRA